MGISMDKSTGTDDPFLAERFLINQRKDIERYKGCPVIYEPLPSPSKPSFIYAIRAGSFFKIGISDNPQSRLYAIQGGNPHGCSIAVTCAVSKVLSYLIERKIHAALADYAVGREWFSAPIDLIERTIWNVVENTGLPTPDRPPLLKRHVP